MALNPLQGNASQAQNVNKTESGFKILLYPPIIMNLIPRVIAASIVALFVISAFAGLLGTLVSGR